MKKVLITLLLLCTFLFADAYKRVVNLKRKGLPINRELVMDPEAWYDTEEHIIDVTMHSVGVLTVYCADGETVHSVNNLTFNLNRVFCDKNSYITVFGIQYDGDIVYANHDNGNLYAVEKDYFNNYENIVIEGVPQELPNPYLLNQ